MSLSPPAHTDEEPRVRGQAPHRLAQKVRRECLSHKTALFHIWTHARLAGFAGFFDEKVPRGWRNFFFLLGQTDFFFFFWSPWNFRKCLQTLQTLQSVIYILSILKRRERDTQREPPLTTPPAPPVF